MEIAYTGNSLISNVKAANKNYYGLYLYNSSNITVSNSEMNGNFNGFYIQKSRNTKIISNNVSLNSGTGIHLDLSSHNEIYLNDFINNSPNVVSFRSSNNWNSSSKITYTYNDNAYTNYLGNYWSDYHIDDTSEDGIGDIPYTINSDKDNYPLMSAWKNYTSEGKEVPGFEVIFVIVELSIIAYLIRGR